MQTLLRLLSNAFRLPFLPLYGLSRLFGRPRGVVVVRVHERLTELERPLSPLVRLFPRAARRLPTPLEALRKLAHTVVRDGAVSGVLFIVPPLAGGWARAASLREVLTELRAGGKRVTVYLPRGGGNRELYVAAAADRLYLPPEATLMPLGLAVEARYIKPLLDRLGVRVTTLARGAYKTAGEAATRDSMSDAQRHQLTELLSAHQRELVDALLARPGLDAECVQDLFGRALLRGDEAVRVGLADGVVYEDELPRALSHGDRPERMLRAPGYLARKRRRFFAPLRRPLHVAVVTVRGAIMEKGPLFGARSADLAQIVAALRTAGRDPRALGVVVHIDSPGGSAAASDLIHREVVRLREKKPVVACFGDVAASGGYYIGAAAQAIVAQPGTLTGSIGVVSAKVLVRGLLDRIGVRTEVLRTAAHADMFSAVRDLTDEEHQLLSAQLDAFYARFVQIVAEGRGLSTDEVEAVAGGRIWAGADALERGLLDRLGGLHVAREEICARLPRRVPPESLPLVPVAVRRPEVPPPDPPPTDVKTLFEVLAPDALHLFRLAALGEGPLFYAFGLPRVV